LAVRLRMNGQQFRLRNGVVAQEEDVPSARLFHAAVAGGGRARVLLSEATKAVGRRRRGQELWSPVPRAVVHDHDLEVRRACLAAEGVEHARERVRALEG